MSNQLIIDAVHPEEVRVAVLRDGQIKEFDFEAQARRSSIGHIYLGKVTRVEPSLQACFVDYGGGRQGFLPLSDIHPDYYQIPKADRDALLAAAHEPAEAEAVHAPTAEAEPAEDAPALEQDAPPLQPFPHADAPPEESLSLSLAEPPAENWRGDAYAPAVPDSSGGSKNGGNGSDAHHESAHGINAPPEHAFPANGDDAAAAESAQFSAAKPERPDHRPDPRIEQVGGEDALDSAALAARRKWLRRYKIQEVIKRNQIILVQIAKQERANKGAALTSYLSLVGRYCVLLPNTARGGALSRKITQPRQRQELKSLLAEIALPSSMGLIVRTSGGGRPPEEIRKDYDYLQNLWNEIRKRTLESRAPSFIHQDGNLIERALRDYYKHDMDEIVIEGADGYAIAQKYMQALMPDALPRLRREDGAQRVFEALGIEEHLDNLLQPMVPLKSGGHLVINQTEALVAVDVNSGKATREHSIEKTALNTNLEAAEEVARQMRLRDLAGLIVIDFIDMMERRNNRAVEKRLKACLRGDRARIQLGRISAFGLMEMSRQRMRAGVYAGSSVVCPHCLGQGRMRSVENRALLALRRLQAQAPAHKEKGEASLILYVPHDVAAYMTRTKKEALDACGQEYGLAVSVRAAPAYHALDYAITAQSTDEPPPPESMEAAAERPPAHPKHMQGKRGQARRRERRGRGGRNAAAPKPESTPQPEPLAGAEPLLEGGPPDDADGADDVAR